jgi:hypothetical protein
MNLGVLGQGPTIGLLGASGEAKAALGMAGDSAFLHLFGAREHGGAQISATSDRAVLRFFDASDRTRAVVGILERENAPGLVFNDPSGTGRAFFMLSPSGPNIDFVDRDKRVVWHAP